MIISFSIVMLTWGIIQVLTTFYGTTTLKVNETGYSIEYYIPYDSIPSDRKSHSLQMQGILYNDTFIVYVCTKQVIYALTGFLIQTYIP